MTFETPDAKREYVNDAFSRIAHRYDLMNRIMSLGQDVRWRKLLIREANLPAGGTLLDIATGTGDIACEAQQQHPDLGLVVAADFTLPMMQVGRTRPERRDLRWCAADTLNLAYPNNAFNAVVSGFLLRNVIDVRRALLEQVRVCKPGGRVVVLEIPRPADNLWGQMFRLYFHNVVPLLGGIISGQPDAYSYLPASADAFLRPDELQALMTDVGLQQVRYHMLMMNTMALHVGQKA